jgi:uncharacterized membrane protein (DUF485 family)
MDVTNARPGDWERIERMPEFRDLVARRRRFVLPATAFFLFWYLGFIVLAGYAEDFMGTSIYEGFTVGYGLALTQFVMVAVLGVWYLRYSERNLDPLRDRIAEQARALHDGPSAAETDRHAVHAGRFDRPPPGDDATRAGTAADREGRR